MVEGRGEDHLNAAKKKFLLFMYIVFYVDISYD